MIKGLNGILIPSLAFGMHLLFSMKNRGFLKSFQLGLRFFALAFLPAALLSAAFFFLLYRKIGPGFTEEFFLVQHFGRSRAPMEAHSGGVLYHPLFILFGGAFLTPVLMRAWKDRRPDLIRFGFPLTYSLAFVLAFTLSATKLPHYTWPAWPALALFAGILHSLRENVEIQSKNQTWTSRVTDMLSCLPVFSLASSCSPWDPHLISSFPNSPAPRKGALFSPPSSPSTDSKKQCSGWAHSRVSCS